MLLYKKEGGQVATKMKAEVNQTEKQRANMDYLREHYEDLLAKYPNHWVMIGGGKVISTENNPDKLISKLSKTSASNKMVYYLASPRKRMLL